jgi:hypothetical protein
MSEYSGSILVKRNTLGPSYQGFLYVKQKNLANGVVSWECEKTSGKILKLHVNYIVQ